MIIIDSKTWIIGAVLAVTRRRVTDGDGRRTRLSDASVCVMGLGRIYRAASGAAEYRSHRDHCIIRCRARFSRPGPSVLAGPKTHMTTHYGLSLSAGLAAPP